MKPLFNRILYYGIVLPISILPFPALYLISGFIFFLAYHLVGYRRKVVQSNLKNAFPKATEKEIKRIEKAFFKHFSDFIVELIKTMTISEKQILKRCTIENPEVPEKYFLEGKDVIVMCGHYNNWEYYALALNQQVKHQTMAAYMPLNDTFFNQKVLNSRKRFGLSMQPMKLLLRFYTKKKDTTMSVLLNDQAPSDPQKAYWNTFLNQETPWLIAPEKIARKYDIPVLFGYIQKKKRGHYAVTFEVISDQPQQETPGAIIEKHTRMLESIIQERPEFWLWSHRRWKHKKIK